MIPPSLLASILLLTLSAAAHAQQSIEWRPMNRPYGDTLSAGKISAVRIADPSGRIVLEREVVVVRRSATATLSLRLPEGMPALGFLQLAIDGRWSEALSLRIVR